MAESNTFYSDKSLSSVFGHRRLGHRYLVLVIKWFISTIFKVGNY